MDYLMWQIGISAFACIYGLFALFFYLKSRKQLNATQSFTD